MSPFDSPPNRLSNAVSLSHPYTLIRDPELLARAERRAAVLVLFAPEDPEHRSLEDSRILLIRRSDRVATHRRQFALPGGKVDPEDLLFGEDATKVAALREAEEETGIERKNVHVLGALPDLLTLTSLFRMTPIVAWSDRPHQDHPLFPHEAEVEKAFWVPWKLFQEPFLEERVFLGERVRAPSFRISEEEEDGIVWGATAIVLQNLAERLGRC